ncbi:MAG TPA: hypothetical protein VGX92_08205 [Pyrinomonadaceae bacterium]|nr:hypothetical protein [Pyrinomonadaceae bacterium]
MATVQTPRGLDAVDAATYGVPLSSSGWFFQAGSGSKSFTTV